MATNFTPAPRNFTLAPSSWRAGPTLGQPYTPYSPRGADSVQRAINELRSRQTLGSGGSSRSTTIRDSGVAPAGFTADPAAEQPFTPIPEPVTPVPVARVPVQKAVRQVPGLVTPDSGYTQRGQVVKESVDRMSVLGPLGSVPLFGAAFTLVPVVRDAGKRTVETFKRTEAGLKDLYRGDRTATSPLQRQIERQSAFTGGLIMGGAEATFGTFEKTFGGVGEVGARKLGVARKQAVETGDIFEGLAGIIGPAAAVRKGWGVARQASLRTPGFFETAGVAIAGYGGSIVLPGVTREFVSTIERRTPAQRVQDASIAREAYRAAEKSVEGEFVPQVLLDIGFAGLPSTRKARVAWVDSATQQYINMGLIPTDAKREAQRLARRDFDAGQLGARIGTLAIETKSELIGRRLLLNPITKLGAARVTAKTTRASLIRDAQTVTFKRLFPVGVAEGLAGTFMGDVTTRRIERVQDVPGQVISDPFKYVFAAGAGGAMAGALGSVIVGGQVAKSFGVRGGGKVSKVTDVLGSTIDLAEKGGDIIAETIPWRGPTIRGQRVRTRVSTPLSSFGLTGTQTPTGLFTPVPESSGKSIYDTTIIPIQDKKPVPSQTDVPTDTDIPLDTFTDVPTDQSINIFIDAPTQTPTQTPTQIFAPTQIPVTTPVPVWKGAPLPFFPATPFGEPTGKGTGKRRKTFVNEFAFARGLLGTQLMSQVRKQPRRAKKTRRTTTRKNMYDIKLGSTRTAPRQRNLFKAFTRGLFKQARGR